MTERISKAIDIFLDAIKTGSLAKGTCAACACGNLVMASLGEKIPFDKLVKDDRLHTAIANRYMQIWGYGYNNETGFTKKELHKIESSFESNSCIHWSNYSLHTPEEIRADQIRGLEAVVQTMMDFDDCKEIVQEVFTARVREIPAEA